MQIPSRVVRRKARLLETELRMLERYRIDISLLLDEYKQEYAQDMQYIESQLIKPAIEDPPPDDNLGSEVSFDTLDNTTGQSTNNESQERNKEQNVAEEASSAPEWAKKLFKKIAMLTHPDRVKDEQQRKKLAKIFLDASEALKADELEKLIGIALELNIDSDLANEQRIPILTKRIVTIKDEIAQIESLPEWIWGEAFGLFDVRVKIALSILSKRGFNDLTNAELSSIIKKREKEREE